MSESQDYVEVTVKLPKPLVTFIQKFCELVGKDFNEFLGWALEGEFKHMINDEEIFNRKNKRSRKRNRISS